MNTNHNHFKPIVTALLWISLSIYVIFSFYAYYHPETKLYGILFTSHIPGFIEKIPVWLYFFIHLTLFSIISFIVFITLSLYHGIRRGRGEKLIKRHFRFFTYALSIYFSNERYRKEENRTIFLNRIKPFVRKRIQLISFLESYLRLQELVAKNLSDEFKLLIEDLNIQKKIESFLYSRNFDDVILALKVLSYLRIKTGIEQIKLLAKNKNFVIRAEAYASLVRLMDDGKSFIDFIEDEHQLSVLNINTIVNAILKNNKENIECNSLLTSNKERRVMVGLVLVKYRGSKDPVSKDLIRNYLGHPNQMLNILAWNALLTILPENEAVDIIVEKFDQETDSVKLKILENCQNITDQRFYDFITKNMGHQSLLVKVEAMKIIFKNTPNKLSSFADSQDRELKMAYDETVCIYIN